MKTNIRKHISTVLAAFSTIITPLAWGGVATGLLTACSPDEFKGASPSGLPTVSGVDFNISVDQETNQMIATYTPQPGMYPVWIINGSSYSTLPEVGYQNPEAGTYTIALKTGNRNGISQGTVTKDFTFNETKIDYTADFRRLCDKTWRIANREVAHMGCGPAGTAATEWWSAAPNDKKNFGVYDDRITFTADNRKGGTYTYNAGDDGMTYVNYGTQWGGGATADIDVALGNQTSTWSFEVYDWKDAEGNVSKQTYIQLGANTLFPYLSSNAQYANPKFRIEAMTSKRLALVYDSPDRDIAWRFILTSEADVRNVEESGFDANSDFNLWKGITPAMTFYYNPDPGWGNEQTAVLEATFKGGNNDYSFTVPNECFADWQAQVHFHTDLTTQAATLYDFSCILNADSDIDGVIIKLTDEGDDGAILEEHVSLKAGQDYVVWKSGIPGKDYTNVKLATDYGHATGETHLSISNIVLKSHADDDGTIVPDDTAPETPVMDWDVSSPANLWTPVESGDAFKGTATWFADNNWTPLPAQPDITHNDGAWELEVPAGTGTSQWQGQVKIFTSVPAWAAKKYNFYCVVESDMDIPNVTIKLTQSDESDDKKHDDNYFFGERHNVSADVPFIYKAHAAVLPKGDAHELTLVYDFGGAPEGAHVKISKVFLEESVVVAYDDDANQWKDVDRGDALKGTDTWFADNGWTPLPEQPDIKHDGNQWSLTVPEGTGTSQWQGQVKIFTSLAAKDDKPCHFQCTVTADADIAGATIKLTQSDESDDKKHDDNFYFDGRHALKADEPFTYKAAGVTLPKGDAHELTLVFDFGGAPAGTNITITDIIFE